MFFFHLLFTYNYYLLLLLLIHHSCIKLGLLVPTLHTWNQACAKDSAGNTQVFVAIRMKCCSSHASLWPGFFTTQAWKLKWGNKKDEWATPKTEPWREVWGGNYFDIQLISEINLSSRKTSEMWRSEASVSFTSLKVEMLSVRGLLVKWN